MKALVCDSLDEEGIKVLEKERDISVDAQAKLSAQELKECIKNYEAIIIRSQTKLGADLLAQADRLKVICRAGTGIDNVDLKAATKKGIVVMNTPAGNTISAAEHTMGMLLCLSRNIPQANLSVKGKDWERKKFMGSEIQGKFLGIIGLGRIGMEVAKRAQGLGMHILGYDPFVSSEQMVKMGIALEELNELLKKADYITVHTPLTAQTRHLLSEKEFSLMKKGARIINCARGGIIDEKALYKAIKEGRVKGAALDVFEEEPPFNSPLLTLPEVIATPHLGASTEEAQARVAVDAAGQVLDFLKKGIVRNALNAPAIAPETRALLQPYLELVEKLGRFQAALIDGAIKSIGILYGGEISGYDSRPLTITAVKAILEPLLGEPLNYVNTMFIAKERGIRITEAKSEQAEDFSNLISIKVKTDKGKRLLAGTILSRNVPRIVRMDDFVLDVTPSAHMLICLHADKPGIVGRIGTILGKAGTNIAGLSLSRKKKGGANLTILNVDNPVRAATMQKLKNVEGLKEVIAVS